MAILSSRQICLQHGKLTSQSCFCFRDGVPGALDICSTRRAVVHSASSTPGGRVGIRWWTGDVPRLLVTLNRACSMGLATVGVVGRPGGGDGGNSLGIETGDATGVASWRRCSIRVETSLNIAGMRVSSPAKNCFMSTIGVSSSNNTASSLTVDVIVGPCRSLYSASMLSASCTPYLSPHCRKMSPQLLHSWLSMAASTSSW